nr:glycosyltransferase family 4 protein [uncultured Massilia sp.]
MTTNRFDGDPRPAVPTASRLPPAHVPARLSITLVTDSADPSGVGEHMITLAAMLQNDVEVSLIFADSDKGSAMACRGRDAGLDTCTIGTQALAEGSAGLVEVLQMRHPDIVHIHAGIAVEGHAVAAAACSARVPAIVRTEHLPYTLRALGVPALEALYARGVGPVDRIICVCEAARHTFGMAAVDPSRYAVIHNGVIVRAPMCGREEVRGRLGVEDRSVILTVARFSEQKQHATLVDALPWLLDTHPDVQLLWAGTGPLQEQLRRKARHMGVAAHISFLGRRDDVPDLMGAADALCVPSCFEGHPLVILEAMAVGLPVVAARTLGITEAVRHEETGLLFPFQNAQVLARTLATLLEDPDLGACLSENGRRAIDEEFSARRMASATLLLYQDVLERRSPGHRTFS